MKLIQQIFGPYYILPPDVDINSITVFTLGNNDFRIESKCKYTFKNSKKGVIVIPLDNKIHFFYLIQFYKKEEYYE